MEEMYNYYQKRKAFRYDTGKVRRVVCFRCAMSAIDMGTPTGDFTSVTTGPPDCEMCGVQLNWVSGEYDEI